MYFRRVPDSSERCVKDRKAEEILKDHNDLKQGFPSEDHPIFVAVDLNNLTFIEMTIVDGAMLVSKLKVMKIRRLLRYRAVIKVSRLRSSFK